SAARDDQDVELGVGDVEAAVNAGERSGGPLADFSALDHGTQAERDGRDEVVFEFEGELAWAGFPDAGGCGGAEEFFNLCGGHTGPDVAELLLALKFLIAHAPAVHRRHSVLD